MPGPSDAEFKLIRVYRAGVEESLGFKTEHEAMHVV